MFKMDVDLKEDKWTKCKVPVIDRVSSSRYYDEEMIVSSVDGIGKKHYGVPVFVQPVKNTDGKTVGFHLSCYGCLLSLKTFKQKEDVEYYLSKWNGDCLKMCMKQNRDLLKWLLSRNGKCTMKEFSDWQAERHAKGLNSLLGKIKDEIAKHNA